MLTTPFGYFQIERFSATPKYLDARLRNRWGYAPLAGGICLIVTGVIILLIQVVLNNVLSGSSAAYANRFDFWFNWAPKITFFLITGAYTVVIGFLVLRRITDILSYALVTGGFILITLDSYFLIVF